jgi:hypothetical protein
MRATSLLCFVLACAPPLVDQPWLVTEPRVVAVLAEPPEVEPGRSVSLRAVIAAPAGPRDDVAVRWTRCAAPPPFSQNESTPLNCLEALGTAPEGPSALELAIPADACAVFGPDVTQAGVRPRDPDATGGYAQPIGVALGAASAFAFVRLRCRPAGVDAVVAEAFRLGYQANLNPSFELRALVDGEAVPWDGLPVGKDVELVADWSASPEESFGLVDPERHALGASVERYDVTWAVTAGAVEGARSSTGRGRWRLPSTPGEGTLWATLRDSRGGAAVVWAPARWSD